MLGSVVLLYIYTVVYHSKIPEFNFRNADEEDWTRLNLEFDKVDWTNLLENQSPEEMRKRFP